MSQGRRSRERGVRLVNGEGMSPKTPWRQKPCSSQGLGPGLGCPALGSYSHCYSPLHSELVLVNHQITLDLRRSIKKSITIDHTEV